MPGKDSDGWCCVERGERIGAYEEDSDVAKTWTWAEIKSQLPSYTIPEDKVEDYWWYSTKAITSIESSYVYPLEDTTELSLESYDIYLALKDKPKPVDVYVQEGTYSRGSYELVVTKTSITYGGKTYQIKGGAVWSTAKDKILPLQYFYLLSDGSKNYTFLIEWYTNNGQKYVNIRIPKEYDSSEILLKYESNFMGDRVKTLNVQ